MENSPFQHSSEQFTSKCREICKKNTRVNILAAFLRAQIHVDIFKLHLGGGGGGGWKGVLSGCSHEWRHSMMVVASMKYPPHRTHIRWGLSSVIFILVVRCMMSKRNNNPAWGQIKKREQVKTMRAWQAQRHRGLQVSFTAQVRPFGESSCLFDCVKAT